MNMWGVDLCDMQISLTLKLLNAACLREKILMTTAV